MEARKASVANFAEPRKSGTKLDCRPIPGDSKGLKNEKQISRQTRVSPFKDFRS